MECNSFTVNFRLKKYGRNSFTLYDKILILLIKAYLEIVVRMFYTFQSKTLLIL